MRSTKTIVVEKEVTTWKCDFCDFQTDDNRGCCGSAPIMQCSFCGKDACRNHREAFFENYSDDYPDFYACEDCIPKVNKCNYIAEQIAGRYDIWTEVVKKVYENFEEYQDYLEDYEPPKEHKPIDTWELIENVRRD